MGKPSRDKGRRNEYELRNYLKSLGWEASRVPLSGAWVGLKGDVKASRDDHGVKLFELKTRHKSFSSIYALYNEHIRIKKNDLLTCVLPELNGKLFSLSSSLDAILEGEILYEFPNRHPLYKTHKRAFGRFVTMHAWLQTCDVLVIKDDRRPFLFMRYE